MNPEQQSSIIGILIFSAIIIFVVGFVVWFLWRLREQKRRETEAEQAFEREFDQEFVGPNVGTIQGTPSLAATTQSVAQTPEQDFYPLKEATPEPSPLVASLAQKPPLEPSTAASPSDQLISRLKEAGLFESNEGAYFPLDPSGSCILVHVKRSKTALIIPRFESEYFISQAIKRFDYVFLILSNHDILVLNKYSDFIAGHFEMK
jgi:hypothetical protein